MNALGDAIGEICKVLLPIPEESFAGNPDSETAVCTLASIDLLRRLGGSDVMGSVSVAGRLLSENRGIDAMLDHLYRHRNVRTVIVCGREVWGHRAGHSLTMLHMNGADPHGRIIGSASPDPLLTAPDYKIRHFREDVSLVDMIGVTDPHAIERLVRDISSRRAASGG